MLVGRGGMFNKAGEWSCRWVLDGSDTKDKLDGSVYCAWGRST